MGAADDGEAQDACAGAAGAQVEVSGSRGCGRGEGERCCGVMVAIGCRSSQPLWTGRGRPARGVGVPGNTLHLEAALLVHEHGTVGTCVACWTDISVLSFTCCIAANSIRTSFVGMATSAVFRDV